MMKFLPRIALSLLLLAPLSAFAYSQPYYQSTYALSNPSKDALLGINAIGTEYIGTYNGSSQFFDGLLSDVYFVDGQQLGPTAFGTYDGNRIWKPAGFSGGQVGYQGFHLDFSNSGYTDFTPSNGSVVVGPLFQTTNYRLICTAQDTGSVVETNRTVTVTNNPGLTFTACDTSGGTCTSDPNTAIFVPSGGVARLSWSATGYDVNSCNVTYPPSGSIQPLNSNTASNSATPAITSATKYVLTCLANGAPASTTVTVGVKSGCTSGIGAAGSYCPTQCAFNTDTIDVQPGSSATLSWCCPAGPAAGTNFPTGGALSGTVSVSPTTNTTYSLSCASGNASLSLHAVKPPAILNSFSATRVRRGGASTLSWTVARMSEDMSCVISPSPAGPQPSGSVGTWVGSTQTYPIYGPTTYTLTCGSDEAGYVSSQATAQLLPSFIER